MISIHVTSSMRSPWQWPCKGKLFSWYIFMFYKRSAGNIFQETKCLSLLEIFTCKVLLPTWRCWSVMKMPWKAFVGEQKTRRIASNWTNKEKMKAIEALNFSSWDKTETNQEKKQVHNIITRSVKRIQS